MLRGLFGPQSTTAMLRGGLEEASATHKVISDRVAHALSSSTSTEFSNELEAKTAQQKLDEENLQRDMVSLADTQIRYEADAKLLQQAYARLRSAIRSNG